MRIWRVVPGARSTSFGKNVTSVVGASSIRPCRSSLHANAVISNRSGVLLTFFSRTSALDWSDESVAIVGQTVKFDAAAGGGHASVVSIATAMQARRMIG